MTVVLGLLGMQKGGFRRDLCIACRRSPGGANASICAGGCVQGVDQRKVCLCGWCGVNGSQLTSRSGEATNEVQATAEEGILEPATGLLGAEFQAPRPCIHAHAPSRNTLKVRVSRSSSPESMSSSVTAHLALHLKRSNHAPHVLYRRVLVSMEQQEAHDSVL